MKLMKSQKKKTKAPKTPKTPPQPLKPETKGFLLTSLALSMFLSQISYSSGHDTQNLLGIAGYTIGWLLSGFFGIPGYFISVFIGWIGWRLLFNKSIERLQIKALAIAVFTLSLSLLLCLIEDKTPKLGSAFSTFFFPGGSRFHLGGSLCWYLYHDLPVFNLSRIVNSFGIALFSSFTMTASLMILFKISPYELATFIKNLFKLPEPPAGEPVTIPSKTHPTRVVKVQTPIESPEPYESVVKTVPSEEPAVRKRVINTPKQEKIEKEPKHALPSQENHDGSYITPQASLLTNPKKFDQSSLKQNLNRQAELLEETFLSFGIEAKVGQINCGPTITSFEVHPAVGVKVQKIKTLENDIALNMEAKSIRIIAPIPGKAAVGIEVPNPEPQEVSFKEMLQAYQSGPQKLKIPVLLGKQVNGEWVMSDLAKMPHCIIAGATGSGKSVCINTIVMSIVMNAKPDEIKLLMVDPKKVELTSYTRLPHMLAPVITEPKEACLALNWLVKEMERRYEIFKQLGVRNIEAFNTRKPNEDLEKALDLEIPAKLPYIVAIIDELADLMMVSASDIETPIARIAQMARAVGIHLILATQRPSREVITGLIKANFPTRISFKVASRINSQIILDDTGAESLLGNGDMLFLPPGTSHLIRAQGAFIRDEDIHAVIKECERQAPPNYAISSFNQIASLSDEFEDTPQDALYEQAKEVVLSTGNASTTFLQRKLKLGYARAANLIDQLESRGIVGPQDGARARKILVSRKGKAESDDIDPEDYYD